MQWHEGNAMALPFPDGTFDVVVCQQGLQFFPDVTAALAEVRRVLVDGGRFAAATWCEIGSCPGHDALARALERHVSPEAARLMYMVFRLGDAATVESALKGSGFGDLRIRREQRSARFPSPEHFTRWVIMGSVVGRTGITVSDEAVAAIVRDVDADLRPHVNADGLAFPMEAHIVLAVS